MSVFVSVTGTCINNTSVMMFKKGSFEIGGTIHPVAIKVAKLHDDRLVQKMFYLSQSALRT